MPASGLTKSDKHVNLRRQKLVLDQIDQTTIYFCHSFGLKNIKFEMIFIRILEMRILKLSWAKF